MKKTTIIAIQLVCILLLLGSSPQLMDIKAAKADTEASAVFRSTGGIWWFENASWPNEGSVSYSASLYIYNLFDSPPYDQKYFANAATVTRSNMLNHIEDYNEEDYATFFIFANGSNGTLYDVIKYWGVPIQSIPVTHYYLYDSDDEEPIIPMSDVDVGSITYGGSNIEFVFLWSCSLGSEIGREHSSYYIDYPSTWMVGTGAAGMPYAWTYRDYTQMSSNGYESPDTGSFAFIGFEGFGVPVSQVIPDTGGKNYGDFLKKFYYNALDDGDSINDALDDASDYVWGVEFDETPLYEGYTYYLPEPFNEDWDGWLRVYGNGNNTLPN
ncbi:MAG: hypothetical protein P8X91_00730 [Candidatus Bathyarchaeota archaeon]|jgi:hypothetical protein